MNIALHISEDTFRHYGLNFNLQISLNLAFAHPEDHYILMLDHPFETGMLPSNCTTVLMGPAIKNRLSLYYWYQFKLPAVLKKYNADIFFPQHNCFCSKTKTKQIFTLQQSEKQKAFVKQQYKDQESANAVFSTLKKEKLPSKFIDKTFDIPYGLPDVFHPYTFAQKENIKKENSKESEYFFAIIPSGEEAFIKTLLKAFSHFKKWQKSSLKLIILTEKLGIDDFHLYKFREDVEIKYARHTDLNLQAALIASAYCNILIDEKDVVASIRCSSPSIFISENENAFDDAALYASGDEKSLSKQMILVYKDEYLRNQIIQETELSAPHYTWQNAANIVYKAISSLQ